MSHARVERQLDHLLDEHRQRRPTASAAQRQLVAAYLNAALDHLEGGDDEGALLSARAAVQALEGTADIAVQAAARCGLKFTTTDGAHRALARAVKRAERIPT